MSEVFSIKTGEKLDEGEIAELEELERKKTDVKPIPPKEIKETWHEAGEIAKKIIADLEKNKEKEEE